MKRCPNCNKEFKNGNYCTTCGIPLVEDQITYDIFGDPIEYKAQTKNVVLSQNNNAILEDTDNLIEGTEGKNNFKTFSKFISLISIGSLFIPLFGQIISIVAMVLNITIITNDRDKKHIPYLAISIATLILSIVFFIMLYKSGVIADLANEVANQGA